jgi:hypothetical protein
MKTRYSETVFGNKVKPERERERDRKLCFEESKGTEKESRKRLRS